MINYADLDSPVTISRKDYIFVLDFINPLGASNDFTQLNIDGFLDIDILDENPTTVFVSTSHSEKMRKSHPDATLIPFWITVANSGLISSDAVHYFYFNDEKTLGCYLITSNSKLIQSGALNNSFVPTHYSIKEYPRVELQLNLEDLVPSSVTIKTKLDIQLLTKKLLKDKKKSKVIGLIAGFFAGLFSVLYIGMTHADYTDEVNLLKNKRISMAADYKTFIATHTKEATSTNSFLFIITRLLSMPSTSISVPSQSMVSGPNYAFIKSDSKSFAQDISLMFGDKLSIEFYSNDKGWRVSW